MIRNAGNDRMTSCDLQQYVAIVRISCRSRRLAASVMASSPRRGWRQRRRLADRTTRSYIDINPRLTARPPGPPPTTIALASPLQSHSPRLALSLSRSLPDTSLICRCVGGHVVHRGSRRYGPIEHCQRAATAASCRVPRACFSSLNCCLLPTTELGRTWSTRLTHALILTVGFYRRPAQYSYVQREILLMLQVCPSVYYRETVTMCAEVVRRK